MGNVGGGVLTESDRCAAEAVGGPFPGIKKTVVMLFSHLSEVVLHYSQQLYPLAVLYRFIGPQRRSQHVVLSVSLL